MAETLKHVCDPKTAKAKDESSNKPSVNDSFKKDVNKLDYEELTKKYKGLISSQNSYQGTGYGYVVRSPKQWLEDQFVMMRYRELKAQEDAKQAAHMAELNKYHYLNLYDTIRRTGRRPDGTPATDLEKKIAPYVPLIPIVQTGASIYAGVQYAKHSSSVPTENGMKWGTGGQKTFKPGELEIHYNKYGENVANALNKNNYTINQYLDDANNIVQNGTYVSEMNAYVKKIGGTGKSAKYAFVGLDRTTGNITTYHVKYAKQIIKKSPNFKVIP